MAWQATLDIDYRLEADAHTAGLVRTLAHGRHSGPLRILRSLYPEGPRTCHNVVVHPPGGVAGGDLLDLSLRLAPGSHALLTTPGATRFYRSAGDTARQSVKAYIAEDARLEWLPLETLVHDATRASNHLSFKLAPGAEMIGWDVLALGLPASGQPFERGRFEQRIDLAGASGDAWLERSVLDFDAPHADFTRRLLASPLGWGGCTVLATVWFARGVEEGASATITLDDRRSERLLDAARGCVTPDGAWAGVTAPSRRLVVMRALGSRVEPLMRHAIAVWSAWRRAAWDLDTCAPRVWRT